LEYKTCVDDHIFRTMSEVSPTMHACPKLGRKKVLALLVGFACCLLVATGCRRVQMEPPVTYPSW
jgi:hypothetical protein